MRAVAVLAANMAIPSCQLDYIQDELQSRNGGGGNACDPDLEAGRHRLLIQILAWDDTLLIQILRHGGHENL
jgi:hypothetical protein